MADTNINFRIGSTFSGEGIRAAQGSVKEMNKTLSAGRSAAMQIAGKLEEMGGAAGTAAKAVNGMIAGFAQGGIAGAAFAVTMSLINKAMEDALKEAEAIKKEAERMTAAVDRAFSAELNKRVSSFGTEVASIVGDFDRITRQANAVTAALNGLRATQGGAKVLNIEIEKYNAVMAAVTEAEKANVAATYDLKIAKEKAANANAAAQEKLDAANQALADGQQRAAKIQEQIAKTRAETAAMIDLRENTDGEKRQKMNDAIHSLRERERQLIASYNDQLAQNKVLEVNVAKSTVDLETAQKQNAFAVQKATDNVNLVRQAGEKRLVEAEKNAKLLSKENEQKALAAELQEKANEAQRQVNENAKRVADAEKAYAEALANYERNYAENKINEALFASDMTKKSGIEKVQVVNRVAGDVADHALEVAVKNGVVHTVKEADKLRRKEFEEAKRALAKREREMKMEQKRYEEIMKRRQKFWSQDDRAFVTKFEAIRDAALAQKNDVAAAKQELQNAKEQKKRDSRNLDAIRVKLDQLGLK